jgi:uncharacterized membrane protein YecN with MAPEG domain
MFVITAPYAAMLALLFLGLSARVILYRRARGLSLGDEGDRALLQRMRAQANCAEYAPFGVLLLALVEAQGAPAIAVHLLGLTLLMGRCLHAWGFGRDPQVMPARVAGTALTLGMIGMAAAGLLLHALL